MINTVNLRNFKLHKDTTIDFGKINVFIGPNNSGKSSVIHALQLLAKWNSGELYKRDPFYIDIKEFEDIISKGEDSSEIGIEGNVLLNVILSPSEIGIANKFIASKNITVRMKFAIEKDKIIKNHEVELEIFNVEENVAEKETIYTLHVETAFAKAGLIYNTHSVPRNIKKKIILKEGTTVEVKGMDFFTKFSISIGNHLYIPSSPLSKIESEIEKVLNKLLLSSKTLIESVHFVYPIRGLETLTYKTIDKRIAEMDINNLNIASRAQSVANAFIYNRLLEDEIYEKMKDVIDVKFYAELGETNQEVKLISKAKNVPFLFEGLGAHQMLFVYLPIFLAKQNDTICIEEPENHLHPKAQYELSKLFVDIAKKQEKQIVITTHSEHIVFGLLNMVAKKELKNDELAIYYFENKDGKAEVKKLEVNEFGQVAGGLPGFFEENLDELIESLENIDK